MRVESPPRAVCNCVCNLIFFNAPIAFKMGRREYIHRLYCSHSIAHRGSVVRSFSVASSLASRLLLVGPITNPSNPLILVWCFGLD